MNEFYKALGELAPYRELCGAMSKDKCRINVMGVAECARAHILSSLMRDTGKRILVISQNELTAREFANELECFGVDGVARLPAADITDLEAESASFDLRASRINALSQINKGASAVVSVPSLLSFVMQKNKFNELVCKINIGDEMTDAAKILSERGYRRVPEVAGIGQFAIRGGIIDVFVPGEKYPYRIELFGDEVDSIRYFDTDSQLSRENTKTAQIIPANGDSGEGCIADYFDDDTIFVFDMPLKISEAGRGFMASTEESLPSLP